MSGILAALVACSGGPTEDPTVAEAAVATVPPADLHGLGWVSRVALQPADFEALVARSKEGWIALHANDAQAAWTRFGDDRIGRARAAITLAVLYADLSRLSGRVAESLFSQWSAKGGLPAGDDAPMVAALAAACSGGETAGTWANKVKGPADMPIAQVMVQGRFPTEASGSGPYGRRLMVHRTARASLDPAALVAAARAPVAVVAEKDFERQFWDPCVYRTLSELWLDRAERDLGGSGWKVVAHLAAPSVGLEGSLFAPWPTTEDLRAELMVADGLGLLGSRSPSMRRLGVGTRTSPNDDADAARQEVEALDAGLDAWAKKLDEQAPDEGRALLRDLGLVARFRQEWLVTRARLALAEEHPLMALVYVELARDHAARGIGPANPAALYAVGAEARLRLGHTREALDALHVVVEAHPEVVGLKETLDDLAVLQGISREGDSKEGQ